MLVTLLWALPSDLRQTHNVLLLSWIPTKSGQQELWQARWQAPPTETEHAHHQTALTAGLTVGVSLLKGEAAPLIWKQILINPVSNNGLVFLSICGPRIKYATTYLQVSFSSFLHFDFSEKVILQWNRGTMALVWSRRSHHGTVTAFCIVRFKRHFWNTITHMYYPLFPTVGTLRVPPRATADRNSTDQGTVIPIATEKSSTQTQAPLSRAPPSVPGPAHKEVVKGLLQRWSQAHPHQGLLPMPVCGLAFGSFSNTCRSTENYTRSYTHTQPKYNIIKTCYTCSKYRIFFLFLSSFWG